MEAIQVMHVPFASGHAVTDSSFLICLSCFCVSSFIGLLYLAEVTHIAYISFKFDVEDALDVDHLLVELDWLLKRAVWFEGSTALRVFELH